MKKVSAIYSVISEIEEVFDLNFSLLNSKVTTTKKIRNSNGVSIAEKGKKFLTISIDIQ